MEAPAEVEASVTEPTMMISTVTKLVPAKPETVSTESETVTAEPAMVEAPMMETATPTEANLLYVSLVRSQGRGIAQRNRCSLCRHREQP
ncbi:MAG: hypothetical protein AAGB04_26110 [Pseudomonadota bacterium]